MGFDINARRFGTPTSIVGKVDKISTPFPTAHVYTVEAGLTNHKGFGFGIFEKSGSGVEGTWTLVWAEGPTHARGTSTNEPNSTLVAVDTYDQGQTLIPGTRRIIHEEEGIGMTADVMWQTPAGRWCIVARQIDGSTPAPPPKFIYSDDEGATWSTSDFTISTGTGSLTEANFNSVVYGSAIPWPASAGGHDTMGWAVFGYSQDRLAVWTTTDDGDNWSEGTEVLSDTGATEMQVIRVGDLDQWMMIYRRDGTTWRIAFSTALVSGWSGITDFPIDGGNNGPRVIQEPDSLTAYFVVGSRRTTQLFPDTHPWLRNHMLIWEMDTAAMWADQANGGAGGIDTDDWSVLCALPDWATAYGDFYQTSSGEWFGCVNFGENANGSTATANRLGIISRYAVPSVGPYQISQLIGAEAINANSDMQVWSNGTSVAVGDTVDRTETADNWAAQRVGSNGAMTISRQAHDFGYALRMQRDSGDTDTDKMNIINFVDRADVLKLRGRLVVVEFIARCGADYSHATNTFEFYLKYLNSATAVAATDASNGTTLATKIVGLTTEFQTFRTDPVRIPLDAVVLFNRFITGTLVGTAATDDWVEIDICRIVPNGEIVPHRARPYAMEKAFCDGVDLTGYWS